MNDESDPIADPSNAAQVEAWRRHEGVFWAAEAARFDDGIAKVSPAVSRRGRDP